MAGLEFLFSLISLDDNQRNSSCAHGQTFFSSWYGLYVDLWFLQQKKKTYSSNLYGCSEMDGVLLSSCCCVFPAMFAFSMEPATGPGLVIRCCSSAICWNGQRNWSSIRTYVLHRSKCCQLLASSVFSTWGCGFLPNRRRKGMKRYVTAVLSASVVMAALCIFLLSLSLGGVSPTLFDTGAFDIFDLYWQIRSSSCWQYVGI